jgi:hypothetical protein
MAMDVVWICLKQRLTVWASDVLLDGSMMSTVPDPLSTGVIPKQPSISE